MERHLSPQLSFGGVKLKINDLGCRVLVSRAAAAWRGVATDTLHYESSVFVFCGFSGFMNRSGTVCLVNIFMRKANINE